MKYQCENCKATFPHVAKVTTEEKDTRFTTTIFIERSACPFCSSFHITEFVEPTLTPEEVSNVYIYDLSSGPQQALDMLLAQGYKIQQRYAKQYFLEKPKTEPIKQEATAPCSHGFLSHHNCTDTQTTKPAKDYITEAQEKAKEAQQP